MGIDLVCGTGDSITWFALATWLSDPEPTRLILNLRSITLAVFGSLGGIALSSCVPLGGWLYDDPTFVLSEMTVRGQGYPQDTLEMVLTACNRNDYPVEAKAVEVSLHFAGSELGPAQLAQPFMLQTRDSTKLTVPLPLPGSDESEGMKGPLQYTLTGFTTLMTPIGERRVELFQHGDVQLRPRDEVAHVDAMARPCRPGRSTLPGYMPTPITLPPPPPNPIPVSGQTP